MMPSGFHRLSAYLFASRTGDEDQSSQLLPVEFANTHVRVRDVKRYYTRRNLKKKRRLGFQLEILFLAFFIPLAILSIVALEQTTQSVELVTKSPFPTFPQSETLPNALITSTFRAGIRSDDEFWQWINNVLFQQVYVEGQCGLSFGNAQALRAVSVEEIPPELPPIMVGAIRVRQLRVRKDTCPASATFMNITCFPAYSEADEDTSSKDPNATNRLYKTASATGEREYAGVLASYPGSGFVFDIPTG